MIISDSTQEKEATIPLSLPMVNMLNTNIRKVVNNMSSLQVDVVNLEADIDVLVLGIIQLAGLSIEKLKENYEYI